MSQLEEIEKLYAKVKTYRIPRVPKKGEEQVTIHIAQIDLDDAGAFDFKEGDSIEETMKKCKKLIAKSLDCKVDKLGKMSIANLSEILDCIMEANNIPKDEKQGIGKITGFLQQKRGQIEAKKQEQAAHEKPA